MKKFYISLSLIMGIAASNTVNAQATTITSLSVPQVGFVYNSIADTLPADMPSYTVSASSASAQVWDYTPQFSGAASLYSDPTSFVAPSSGTGNSSFPSSNLAANIGGRWVYFIGGASGLFIDGVYAVVSGNPASLNFTPDPAQIPTPYTYGSAPIVTSYSATTVISGYNAYHYATRTISADAFGSLTTPTGTYPNVLRVKTYEITADTVFFAPATPIYIANDTTTNYTWLQNSQDALLMSIDQNHLGAVTKASYLQSFSNSVATIGAPSAAFNVYPNPASGVTNFVYENKSTGMVNIQLVDLTGKQVAILVNEQQAVGKQNVSINLEALHIPKGLYFLKLNSGNTLQTIKLSVN
jgi:hypothetical protein